MYIRVRWVVEFLTRGYNIMYTDFIEKINVTNRFFFCILKTDLVWGLQKLDIILENKVILITKEIFILLIKSS